VKKIRCALLAGTFLIFTGQDEGCSQEDVDGDGWTVDDGDCNDLDPETHPGAEEVCDREDNDCDGEIDNDPSDPSVFYADEDGDGFGDPENTASACSPPEGYVTSNTDCNDNNADVNPAADEICNFIDDDCDEEIDEGFSSDSEECPDAVIIDADATNVKLDELLAYPSDPIEIWIVVEEGVTISSLSVSEPAFSFTGLSDGSLVYLVNRGTIHGRGGDGACSYGGAGQDGGDAIEVGVDLFIDNTEGYIFGGGGGGGAGDDPTGGGGGAGGGLGCDGGLDAVDGVGGDGPDRWGPVPGGDGADYDGTPGLGGAAGNPGSPGGGGSGGAASDYVSTGCCASQGGAGGGWGGGGGGGGGVDSSRNFGPGGDAGLAVHLTSGGSVSWIGGDDLDHLKGQVE